MKKLLYNKTTGLLQPWPAGDAEHVDSLEGIYEEMEIIQSEPPVYNNATHHLEPTQTINLEERTVQRGWIKVVNPPPPTPTPTMRSFRLACGRALWTRIAAAIAGITDEDAKWEALQYIQTSPSVARNHPMVVQLAAALSPPLADEQIDSVFALALQIDAQA